MKAWQAEILDEYLDAWFQRMSDDLSEYRRLHFKSRSVGTYDKLNLDHDSDDNGYDFGIQVVEGAIASLTQDQRSAVHFDLRLSTINSVSDQEARLEEARQRIWKALVTQVVVSEGGV